MDFNEFPRVEENDYDIKNSSDSNELDSMFEQINPYSTQLVDLIGILEDVTDEELAKYGITVEEYMHPTEETINRVKDRMNGFGSHR